MNICPYCQTHEGQVKAGLNKSGSQRYRCQICQRRYTPTPKIHGYSAAMRHQAIQNYVDGMNLRRIGRMLGLDHHTVINWVTTYTQSLPNHPPLPPKTPQVCELDEVFTFITDKKTKPTSLPM
jgi:transposase-like protein